MKHGGLGIGAVSERSRVNIETIRYYERIGLMPAPPRSQGNQRIYDGEHLKRLVFIRRARELGFSLEDIRGLLQLMDCGDYTCGDVCDVANDHIAEIRRKIADLRRMEKVLKEMASQCERGDLPECPILEALSS